MDVTMSFHTQEIWTWWIAVYLFMGGLGAATLTITFLTDMYVKHHKDLVLWGAWSGIVMLAIGSLMLFIHLLDYGAVLRVLNPLVLVREPGAWIAWGSQFILWMMFWGVLYSLPYMIESPAFNRIPGVRQFLRWGWVNRVAYACGRYCKVCGWLAAINGIGTAVYTGLLLQSFPAVALWHNPGVPLLFTISAFSTAFAYLLLVLHVVVNRPEDHGLRVLYERLDLILIASELVVIFSFYQYMQAGSASLAKSAEILWNDMGWLVGFIGFGLIVPFLLELKGVIKGWGSIAPTVFGSVLVLVGGYLLRHYFLVAGVYAHPW